MSEGGPPDTDGPAVPGAPELTPLRQKIYDAISTAHRPLTVEEVAQQTGVSSHTVGPRCNDLHRAGLIEPAGKGRTSTGRMAGRWKVVPPDRVSEVQQRAKSKPKRRKSVLDLTAEEQANIVRVLVRLDSVNAILLADTRQSTVAGRARREGRSYQQRRRQLQDEIRRAEEESSPLLQYLKAKRLMADALEALRGMARNVFDESEIRLSTGTGELPDDRWTDIRMMANDHRILATAIEQGIGAMLGEIEEDDIIDVEVIDDVESWELPPG